MSLEDPLYPVPPPPPPLFPFPRPPPPPAPIPTPTLLQSLSGLVPGVSVLIGQNADREVILGGCGLEDSVQLCNDVVARGNRQHAVRSLIQEV